MILSVQIIAYFWLVDIDYLLRDTVRGLWVIAHKVWVDKVDSKAIKLVSHVLIASADKVIAQVSNLTKGSQELSWGDSINFHHTLLGGLAAEDADIGLEVFSDPLARSLAILGHGLVDMRRS